MMTAFLSHLSLVGNNFNPMMVLQL